MFGLFSKSLFSKIQNLAILKQGLAFFSYKLLSNLSEPCVLCTLYTHYIYARTVAHPSHAPAWDLVVAPIISTNLQICPEMRVRKLNIQAPSIGRSMSHQTEAASRHVILARQRYEMAKDLN